MTNKFSFLQISITPWIYPGTDTKKLEVKIRVNGQKLTMVDYLYEDDFESSFDRSMDYIKYKVKDSLKLLENGEPLTEEGLRK